MNKPPNKLNNPSARKVQESASTNQPKPTNIQTEIRPEEKMLQSIRALGNKTLQHYEIRDLVKEAEPLGRHLQKIELKTNQIRKFLDAVNQIKVKLAKYKEQTELPVEIKNELVMLKPKLAYAVGRSRKKDNENSPVEPLSNVISEAIDKVEYCNDFHRLAQIIESIVAYHKFAGGKDQ